MRLHLSTYLLLAFVATTGGCHDLPWLLDDYCHDDPMTRIKPDATADDGPFPCISYCIEQYPEHEGIPTTGTGAWCDDLGTPIDYGAFCFSYPAVAACDFWCTDHPGQCVYHPESDAGDEEDGGDGG